MKVERSGESPYFSMGHLRRNISVPYRAAFIGTAPWLSCSLPNSPFFSSIPKSISRVLLINVCTLTSQSLVLRQPYRGHQASFPLPFVSFSLSPSLSLFLPLPVKLHSFSPPLLSDLLPHSLLTFQTSFLCSYSCSLTVPVASVIGSHPEAFYWVEVPILQLPWVLVYNSLHLQTSLEDCP